MAMLNPEELDSKGGTSGTVEVVAAGDFWEHDLCHSNSHKPCLGVGGYLPQIGHERGRSHLTVCEFLAFDWPRGPLEAESDD